MPDDALKIFDAIASINITGDKTVLEVGSDVCSDTKKIQDKLGFVSGRYICLEPDPDNLQRAYARLSELNKVTIILPFAASDRNGLVTFNRSSLIESQDGKEHRFSGSIKTPTGHLTAYPWCAFKESIPVQSVRLDDLAAILSIDYVDFMWWDVQGTEDMVIDGAVSILSKTSYLCTEYSSVELYDKQLDANGILSRLPGKWEIVNKWEENMLLKRT